MKIKIIFAALLFCGVAVAQVKVEELEKKIEQRYADLLLLSEKVRKQARIVSIIKKNENRLIVELLKKRKNNSNQIDKKIAEELDVEIGNFLKTFFDAKNKNEQYLVSSTFLADTNRFFDENAAMLKFYLASFSFEADLLRNFLIEWEELINEISIYQNEINKLRNNSK